MTMYYYNIIPTKKCNSLYANNRQIEEVTNKLIKQFGMKIIYDKQGMLLPAGIVSLNDYDLTKIKLDNAKIERATC